MKIHLLAISFLLAGCTTVPPTPAVEPEVRRTSAVRTIKLYSLPPGSIVEVNGEYIGQTPMSLVVDADANGCWPRRHTDGTLRPLSTTLVCTAPDGFTDTRLWFAGDRIPETILFRPHRRFPERTPLHAPTGS